MAEDFSNFSHTRLPGFPHGPPPGMPFPSHHYPPHFYPPPPHHHRPPTPTDDAVILAPDPTPPPPPQGHGNWGYYWVDSNEMRGVFSTSVRGGVDQDGSEIYVGRAYHDGDWVPAKVIPARNEAYISYDGKEHMVYTYQLLCEQRFEWVTTGGDNIPPNAVEGGRTSAGEILYIGRVHHEGSHTVGKVHPSHRVCYIPFNGEEVAYADYEILVRI